MNKILKFNCDEKLVLIPLISINKIEFIDGNSDSFDDFECQMSISISGMDDNNIFTFDYKKKNEKIIVKAIEDFYTNNKTIWELEEELPFE